MSDTDTTVALVISRDETNEDNCLIKIVRRQFDLDTNARYYLSRSGDWVLVEEGAIIPDDCIYSAHLGQWADTNRLAHSYGIKAGE